MVIFNNAMEDATYPNRMKIAKVLALFKKNPKYVHENYIPISLLSSLDKIFEKIIYKRFSLFIEKHTILYLQQYGFRKKHSTALALIDLTDKIREILDKKHYALGIYLDLEKAFDTVNHKILLTKMEAYGFREHINDFIKSYLTNRQQFTVINGRHSSLQRIDTGVPQGSVLGPLFFLLYINDIPKCITGADITLFTDDTSVLLGDGSLVKLKAKAEKCLKSLDEWFKSNKLTLSTEKTFFIIYH